MTYPSSSTGGGGEGHMLVTFGNVSQAADDCDGINREIQQELGDLKSYLAPLVSVWTGQASEDYQALQRQWDGCASDLSLVLTDISRALRVAYDNYTQTERANASIWAG